MHIAPLLFINPDTVGLLLGWFMHGPNQSAKATAANNITNGHRNQVAQKVRHGQHILQHHQNIWQSYNYIPIDPLLFPVFPKYR